MLRGDTKPFMPGASWGSSSSDHSAENKGPELENRRPEETSWESCLSFSESHFPHLLIQDKTVTSPREVKIQLNMEGVHPPSQDL